MVFEDPTRKRWRIAVASFTSLALVGLVIFGLAATALMTTPFLPSLQASTTRQLQALPQDQVTKPVEKENLDPARWNHPTTKHDLQALAPFNDPGFRNFKKKGSSLVSAFLLQSDVNSLKAFNSNAARLDVVYPDWYYLTSGTCQIDTRIDSAVTDQVKASGVAMLPRLTDGANGKSYAAAVHAVLQDPKLSQCVAQSLASNAERNGALGISVDLESLNPNDDSAFLRFLADLKQELRTRNKLLVADIPAGNNAYDAKAIGQIADGVLVIMHGEHYAGGKPGPIASLAWFKDTLNHFAGIIPKDKLLVGLGSYGFDWDMTAGSPAQGLTYQDVMTIAGEASATPSMDSQSRAMAFGYKDEQGHNHAVWFQDASVVWNQWKASQGQGILGFGLWRLGSEDPNVWSFLGNPQATQAKLDASPPLATVQVNGRPEIFKLNSLPQAGKLSLEYDQDGLIKVASYQKLPTGYKLEPAGTSMPAHSVVFTIYGGPDPILTPQIMDYLDKNQVPAVFFVQSDKAQAYPALLSEILNRGYLLGNGGFPRSGPATADAIRTEINATQRAIENAGNRHTLLYRNPLDGERLPDTPEDLAKLQPATDLGYLIVGANAVGGNGSADHITAAVISGLADHADAHVVALDGNDPNTLAALQKIVPELKARSYTFLSLDKATGISKNELSPPVGSNEAVLVAASGVAGTMSRLFWPTIFWIFALTTGFSIFRILFMSVFVLRSLRHRSPRMINPGSKPVSILIPAYNEEKTIGKTLSTLQQSTHKKFEALVIDDGSSDNTASVVKDFAAKDPRIKLIRKENGGKSTALNLGMRRAKYDIVITIDADTVLLPETVNELIKPFADPKVDAVCGNVEVGNIHSLLTGFQALEYITAQNFDRRAFDEINAISVVPGATGAWRRARVLGIGGYESDTLTEDADLTIRMLAAGGKIVYAPAARSKTEAPEKMRDLAKQRFRWSFGTFQCLGKHAQNFFKGTVGWVALPNIFVFQILFPLVAPIGDLALVLSIWDHAYLPVVYGYLAFTLMDVIGSVFAFAIEKKPKQLMLLVLVQRFFYRQFLYITIIRAIIAMLRGQRYGWNKLQRTGTVKTAAT